MDESLLLSGWGVGSDDLHVGRKDLEVMDDPARNVQEVLFCVSMHMGAGASVEGDMISMAL